MTLKQYLQSFKEFGDRHPKNICCVCNSKFKKKWQLHSIIDKKCFGLIYTHQIGFHVNLRRIWPLSHDECERLLVKGPVWNLTVVIFGKNVLQRPNLSLSGTNSWPFFFSKEQFFFKTTSKSLKYGECMRNWNINIYLSVSSIIYYLWCNIQKHNPVDVYSKQNAFWIWLHRSLLDNKIKAKDINLPQ